MRVKIALQNLSFFFRKSVKVDDSYPLRLQLSHELFKGLCLLFFQAFTSSRIASTCSSLDIPILSSHIFSPPGTTPFLYFRHTGFYESSRQCPVSNSS